MIISVQGIILNSVKEVVVASDLEEKLITRLEICQDFRRPVSTSGKQYANATLDMCWSWIINPVAAKDFLKKFIVTVPSNKNLTFGGDYKPIECVLGHSIIACNGIALALAELVEENYISLTEALALVDQLLNGNPREILRLEEKQKLLKNLDWDSVLISML